MTLSQHITTCADVADVAEEIYGERLGPSGTAPASTAGQPYVLHPTAVWRRGDGTLVTIKINDDAPRSDHDFFVLNLARARADAIVTSGKILREEPELSHDLQGPGRVGEALLAWRRERLGKARAPVTLILTSGRGLDPCHPLLRGQKPAVIFTSPAGRDRISKIISGSVEIATVERPDLCSAVSFLYEKRQAKVVSIETGPSTSSSLYSTRLPRQPSVAELLLSVYEAPNLDERAEGGDFIAPELIATFFERRHGPHRILEPSGPWSFSRFLLKPL